MSPSRARTYVRARWTPGSRSATISVCPRSPVARHFCETASLVVATVAPDSEFCVRHAELLTTVGAENLRAGRIPKKRSLGEAALHVVTEPAPEAATMTAAITSPDPATIRPSLALAAAANVEQLTASLLEAAGSAIKPVWVTVECSSCGTRSRVEAPVPDVRARVAAIELLLREGLGRPATAEEVHSPLTPTSVGAVKEMSWEELEALFAAIYVDEIAAAQRDGGRALLRGKLAALSEGERRALRDAILEPEFA
jgi:hypothetical protein